MTDQGELQPKGESATTDIAIGVPVCIFPGTDRESTGVVVDDYGADAGHSVQIGDQQIAQAARRWAVALDDGGLVFADSDDLTPS